MRALELLDSKLKMRDPLNYLLELRRRSIYVLLLFASLFLLFFLWAPTTYHLLVHPLVSILPQHRGLIATEITTAVFTPLKLAADVALLLTAPFALYQLWLFVSPALYQQEKSHLRQAICLSLMLFGGGMLFCFYIVLPFMLQFFAQALPQDVQLMPDMASALDFITRMMVLFGFCFQVPLLCLLLVRLHWLDLSTLRTIRPYVIVSAFILGMLLTPPDVLSQIILAVPLCLLYELGIFLVMITTKS